MTLFTIDSKASNVLSNNEIIVYGGKNGFTTDIGSIPVLCTAITANVDSIVLTLSNIHLLIDDNSMNHILDLPQPIGLGSNFIKVPFNQYSISSKLQGAIAHYERVSNVSLPITSYNISSNTITVSNQEYDGSYINSVMLTPPFYIALYQPVLTSNFSNRSAYVSGSFISKKINSNVAGINSEFTLELPIIPIDKKFIDLYLDGSLTSSFTWSGSNSISFVLTGKTSNATVVVSKYTVPAIERKDIIAMSTFNSYYTVSNASYQTSDAYYNQNLTNNSYYKIKFDTAINSDIPSQPLINITRDFEGAVSNVTSNSFDISIDPRTYPFTYELANNNIYYLYQKNKVQTAVAKLDEYGRLNSLFPTTYLLEATNINRYNRATSTVKKLIVIDPLEIAKITSSNVTEQIFIDTTGGASIIANISFSPIKGRDVESYKLRWRVLSQDSSVSPSFTDVTLKQDESADVITFTTPPLNRGRIPGSNILSYEITPQINNSIGFTLQEDHPLIGKQSTPAGVTSLTAAQQDNFLIFNWSILLTKDGFIFDVDAKEVEIRRYPEVVDLNNQDDIDQAWGVSIIVDRVPFPSTNYSQPISVFGTYTYLVRVRDTSDIESDTIAAAVLKIERSTSTKVYKAYNEREPDVSYIIQDGALFPNSNVNPEASFPSFSESINGGLIFADSSNVDNSNGSATGFSVYSTTDFLTTGSSPVAEYITQIRDIGRSVIGTVRINSIVSINNPSIAFPGFINTIISDGESDPSPNSTVLVDTAFSGIGRILGFNNANAAAVSYNSFHRTLTSGGPLGNIYAIVNPGQFFGDTANANSYALIAGTINANAIALGEVYLANGQLSGSNTFANLTVSGNSYQLVNLIQYGDEEANRNFLGPSRSILQNIFFRYATENVFYSAASNGISGYPNHGNTNAFAFVGAASNAELGWKPYIAGEIEFRYLQIKIELTNKSPDQFEILLADLEYEIDLKEKNFRKSTTAVNSVNGVVIDYSFVDFIQIPTIIATPVSSFGSSLSVVLSNVSEKFCNVQLFDSNGVAVNDSFVNITAIGI
jgi:hypothetical protein